MNIIKLLQNKTHFALTSSVLTFIKTVNLKLGNARLHRLLLLFCFLLLLFLQLLGRFLHNQLLNKKQISAAHKKTHFCLLTTASHLHESHRTSSPDKSWRATATLRHQTFTVDRWWRPSARRPARFAAPCWQNDLTLLWLLFVWANQPSDTDTELTAACTGCVQVILISTLW